MEKEITCLYSVNLLVTIAMQMLHTIILLLSTSLQTTGNSHFLGHQSSITSEKSIILF